MDFHLTGVRGPTWGCLLQQLAKTLACFTHNARFTELHSHDSNIDVLIRKAREVVFYIGNNYGLKGGNRSKLVRFTNKRG